MKEYNFFKTKEDRKRFYLSRIWRATRFRALERDNWECQWCKDKGKVTTRRDMVLEVDHIEELQDRPDLALKLNNLRVLCKICHNKRHERNFTKSKHKEYKWNDEHW